MDEDFDDLSSNNDAVLATIKLSKYNFVHDENYIIINNELIKEENINEFAKAIDECIACIIIFYGEWTLIDGLTNILRIMDFYKVDRIDDLCIINKYPNYPFNIKSYKFLKNNLYFIDNYIEQYYLLTKKEDECTKFLTTEEYKSQTNLIIFDIDNIDFKELTKFKSLKNLSIVGK